MTTITTSTSVRFAESWFSNLGSTMGDATSALRSGLRYTDYAIDDNAPSTRSGTLYDYQSSTKDYNKYIEINTNPDTISNPNGAYRIMEMTGQGFSLSTNTEDAAYGLINPDDNTLTINSLDVQTFSGNLASLPIEHIHFDGALNIINSELSATSTLSNISIQLNDALKLTLSGNIIYDGTSLVGESIKATIQYDADASDYYGSDDYTPSTTPIPPAVSSIELTLDLNINIVTETNESTINSLKICDSYGSTQFELTGISITWDELTSSTDFSSFLALGAQGTEDTVYASSSYILTTGYENLELTAQAGTAGGTGNTLDNKITGNSNNNLLSGLDGYDTIYGNAGNDTIYGGVGDDSLSGGDGNDFISGLTDPTKPDRDTMNGGLGNDIYVVNSTGDVIVETSTLVTEIDTVRSCVTLDLNATSLVNIEHLELYGTTTINATGNGKSNHVYGNSGANFLKGMAGNDTLMGKEGNDSLDGGAGNDVLIGGVGNDLYYVDSSGDVVSEAYGAGTDTVRSTLANYSLTSNIENGIVNRTTGSALNGNALANSLSGNSGNDSLSGGAGNDTLSGGAGDDLLTGGSGIDRLTGGTGKDTFVLSVTPNATTNLDTITDFSAIDDTIRLSKSVFTKFTTAATLTSTNFVANTSGKAVDSNDYIVYETDTGKVFYDADGSGAGAAVQILTLMGTPSLTAADFVVV